MSTVKTNELPAVQEQDRPGCETTEGLIELSAVTQTQGGVTGWTPDIGLGLSFFN